MSRTALITGCSSGIGRATATAFADAGWTVHATAREVDDLTGLADRECRTAALDVTDGDQVDAVGHSVFLDDAAAPIVESRRVGLVSHHPGAVLLGGVADLSEWRHRPVQTEPDIKRLYQ